MTSDWAGVSVLIVDDHKVMRHIVSIMLKGFGISSVQEAASGQQAREVLCRSSFDLVIIDHNLEDDATGTDLIRHIRTSDTPNRFSAIIMLSGHASRQHVGNARDAGVNEFISKPVTAGSLSDKINSILRNPRPFIRSPTYFGPDRRRRDDPTYKGPLRRVGDPILPTDDP